MSTGSGSAPGRRAAPQEDPERPFGEGGLWRQRVGERPRPGRPEVGGRAQHDAPCSRPRGRHATGGEDNNEKGRTGSRGRTDPGGRAVRTPGAGSLTPGGCDPFPSGAARTCGILLYCTSQEARA
eukprot:scaffold48_cov395-Prasinococcus_capsulatus_cf.AAC.11